jgi:hypothetical protein
MHYSEEKKEKTSGLTNFVRQILVERKKPLLTKKGEQSILVETDSPCL